MQFFVLTEFCEHGSLQDYLRINCMKFEGVAVNATGQYVGGPGAVEQLLNYSYQTANGMEYLALERVTLHNVIHRDLALRNLLLTDAHIVKISDFGLSRRFQRYNGYRKKPSSNEKMPMFWMALESLCDGEYTEKSDVWSFGVVLWEMFSCGNRPYPDHEPDINFRCWLMQADGNRLGPPKIACDEIYQLMRNCWKRDRNDRPNFSACKRSIACILEQLSPSMYESVLLSLSRAWRHLLTKIEQTKTGDSKTIDEPTENSSLLSIDYSFKNIDSNLYATEEQETIPAIKNGKSSGSDVTIIDEVKAVITPDYV